MGVEEETTTKERSMLSCIIRLDIYSLLQKKGINGVRAWTTLFISMLFMGIVAFSLFISAKNLVRTGIFLFLSLLY